MTLKLMLEMQRGLEHCDGLFGETVELEEGAEVVVLLSEQTQTGH